MYDEDELLPVSALQHLIFCERQYALIHLEGAWEDNALTAQGRLAHERVDEAPGETREGVRIARGLALQSLRLGIAGRADVVEFHSHECGVRVDGLEGRWRVYPIEYKRGQPKEHRADEVQVCAQAMCLEEMLGTTVEHGALYYGKPRRRTEVRFDDALRDLVERSALRLHEILDGRRTPVAVYEPKCDSCSLIHVCRPKAIGKSVASYLARSLEDAEREAVEGS